MPNNQTYNHKKNIINETTSSSNKLESGDIVMFNYSGKKVTTRRPLVLVLHPKWKGHLHGLNLDYISPSVLKGLWEITKLTVAGKVEKLIKLRLPLLKADIGNPQAFYKTRLKSFLQSKLGSTRVAYRTYKTSSIGGMKKIDYRFKDSAFATKVREEAEESKLEEK